MLSDVKFPTKKSADNNDLEEAPEARSLVPTSLQLSRIDPDDTDFLNQLDAELKRTEANVQEMNNRFDRQMQ